ncbi:phosphoenolpyruvate--protein phosphotransferase [Rhodocyclus purpureus]|uniref:phosphoenolpyruvate--protein phosphotransferase n=1 Tax=Rhodocyclus purpureus TaxID=1067 RepID=UPI0019120138|nr:phosphoenolpyruvate--protein phosphotransferase [Rhodocyclus purpureus]MBK5914008.1 phosphoenolpyruvate--protein phosphotransferase [Rhodocyclus purpureus]
MGFAVSYTLHGLSVSGGIAIGEACLLSQATLEVAHRKLAPRQLEKEVARFEAAMAAVRGEYESLKKGMGGAPSEFGAFIDLHSMILSDPELAEAPKVLIREKRCNAEWALLQQMEHLVGQFDKIDDLYLRERAYDIRQAVERVIKELSGHDGRAALKARGQREEHQIIVAHDLSPADVMAFKEHRFGAFITDVGGFTSHTAILARGLRIPAVLGLHHARQLIRDKEKLIVDGTRGVVIVNPDQHVLEEYELRKSQIEIERSKLKRLKDSRARTLDRVDVELLANIEMPSDVPAALEAGAEGVGLFRTEFLFLGRSDMPCEDEQFEAYRKVVRGMEGRTVTIRTFDLGNDKGPYFDEVLADRVKTNPALGLRAIRLSLSEPAMFQTQLRAILRAAHYGKVKLLVPMLAHAHEIDQTLAAVEQAKLSLRNERIPYDEDIRVGGMIEIPAAALAVGMFLRRLKFLSIGTNDLIQYTLAIDRSDEQVAHLYDPLHPAVLMLLAHTITSADKAGCPVSVCGEMAGDVTMTRLLLGMGLRQFSMQPGQLLEIKQRILTSDTSELAPAVRRLLRCEEPAKIREQLDKLNAM